MRIYGNRQLKTLPGQLTRPTPARVREALFNIWQGKIAGCRWLDLCAGTGAMGAEALCRGAAEVVGIDRANRACGIIRQNWQSVAQPHQTYQVVRGDVVERLQALWGQQQFDLIYFDPPYDRDLYRPVLEAIARTVTASTPSGDILPLLAPEGELAVEHRSKHWNLDSISGLTFDRQKVYGNTTLRFYRIYSPEVIPPPRLYCS
ncbi:MAG TPA: 16S rRNA (guanine(966)-N(2))-methyltransferase RsmD [Oscillatoriales cyanobacterium M59_W2019_021]|nr:MAG: 16S rRNA (guanine(966)-N(2))-methyltransferase RsmD [Cyanobacteria bacterium J055]HIK32510.1 16S rRNA (guanine(966)-N(2))-methyltransferase RsmD [Oscillatoriales cyanobacterium M4454_W2019_049]HIK49675.1 16S rRNA (guanine(966)-N(2))-methyltransferase RsmD [Oscillatoriales cyanobacterium M59_W2019_021]